MSEITRRRLLTTGLVGGPALFASWTALARQDSPATPGATPEASPGASPAASPAAGGATALNAVDINWEPKELSIPADTDVTITVTNTGLLQHDFVIDDLSINSGLLNGGDSADVVINAPAGTYDFYCSVPGHKEAGMVGTLTVG